MKIISDDRELCLSKLFSKYNYDNMYNYFESSKPWYFIPPELVLTEYTSWDGESCLVLPDKYYSSIDNSWMN